MKINIEIGNTTEECYEQGLHPKSQIEAIKKDIFTDGDIIYTNSPYVLEAINKYHKNIELNIIYNGVKIDKTKAFTSFSEPFSTLVFD